MIYVSIAKDFSTTPGVRYPEESDFSGQEFRENILLPKIKEAINKQEKITVDLDGTDGLGPSFLEESFGGLIRKEKIILSDIKKYLTIVSLEDPSLEIQVWEYIVQANDHENKK